MIGTNNVGTLIITNVLGNVQSYALSALREGMSYVLGMEEVCNTPDIVEQLYRQIDSDTTGKSI